ncbi:hypothetical protein Tco_1351522 [Tanacetum coccineum]
MSDSEHSTVTYTLVSIPVEDDSDIGSPRVDGPPIMPEDPYAYIMAAYEVPPSPDYIPGPEEDEILSAEEQPLPAAASPTADSPGYVPESDPEEEPEEDDEDPEEDLADYPADRDDDDDEDEDDDEEEEEEHPAPADFVPPIHRMTARISIRDEPSISLPPREEVKRLLALTTPPSSPLSPYSSPLPQIPSPPLPIPSPLPNSPMYSEAPLGCRDAGIRQRDTPPSPVHETEIPKICLPLRKRPCRTAPTLRYEVRESSVAGAARHDGHAVARADLYGFIDRETTIMYGMMEDAQDDRSLLRARVNLLYGDRPVHRQLQSADHRRQGVIKELLAADHQRQIQLTKALKLLKGLQTQMVELQRQHGPAKGPAQPNAPGEAGSSS